MFYQLLKIYARLAIKIFCRKIIINKPSFLHINGPVLLAANHPNSFLDGIILTILFDKKVYSLARGDAFSNKKFASLLRWLNLLPVYRYSEGAENLNHNYTTFKACHQALARNNIVLIFSEGGSENEWQLRPLRKGTARLALGAWQKGIDTMVIPVGLNYNPFRFFGKNVHINFGEPLNKASIINQSTEGKQLLSFTEQLKTQLQQLVYEIDKSDRQKLKKLLYVPQPAYKKILLTLPAIIGWLFHAPLYYPAKLITHSYFNNEHYDAAMASLLYLAYPIYLAIIIGIGISYFGLLPGLCLLLISPFTAWACVQLKVQM